jgi:tetratricopeptide (TPR) repeat protein
MTAETSLPKSADAVDAIAAAGGGAAEPARLYDAFISYSHAKDKPIAAALQSAVQRLGKAWYQRRALRVFRDDTSLTATPHLWPSIEQALARSRFLILLASPQAAASPWVDKELAWWLAHNTAETVLIALTAGDLEWQPATGDPVWSAATPLPPALNGHLADEPRWIDLRPYRDNARPTDRRFGELAADFAAAIRGVPKEDLLSQEVRQQRRALRLAWSAVVTLVVLSGLAGWQWHVAEVQRARAEQTLAAATEAANTLIFDMAQRFRLTAGVPVAVIKSILTRARRLQASLLQTGQVSTGLRESEAQALTAMSTTLLQQGDIRGALAPAERARQIVEGLLAADGASAVREDALAVIDNQIGDTLLAENRVAAAGNAYRKSLAIIDGLVARDPKNRFWQAGLATSYGRMGRLQARDGRLREAFTDLGKSVAIDESLAAAGWHKAGNEGLAAFADEQIGDVQMAAGKPPAALAAYRASLTIFETLAASDPNDSGWQHGRAVCEISVGDAHAAEGKTSDALTAYRKALTVAAALAAANPGEPLWHKDLATAHEHRGRAGPRRRGGPRAR